VTSNSSGLPDASSNRTQADVSEEPWVVPEVGPTTSETIPMEVLDAAQRAFEARSRNTIVLPVIFDSLLGERRAGASAARRLRFGDDDPAVEVLVDDVDGRLRLEVILFPAVPADVTVRHGGGVEERQTDDRGHAVVDAVATGPLSISVAWHASDVRIETAWVSL
jgi:hypothetical protein